MYNIYEKSFPQNNLIFEAETEEEAIEVVSYFQEGNEVTVFYEVETKEEIRKYINHQANIFANNM
ncbi:hypothetical protein [Clostridium tagluense]|uniref:Uncharacterized protein n=1 Tax=Clostridium tagluense TaxID=360422 RepID=A0A401USY0_9CLOT|nr:hypothetical protein [Clostridium tagluense]GCD12611.1 hypothetical protein Ctaglu_42340 [Clostridium tagluense]